MKLYQNPQPKDISNEDACRFLQALGWRMKQRRGTSHVQFVNSDWTKLITLVNNNKDPKPYHIRLIKEHLVDKGLLRGMKMKINKKLLKDQITQDPQVSSTADEEICKEYDNLPYMVNIQYYLDQEQGYWIAEHPELPGCITHGLSREEALSNLEDARKGWLYAVISEGEKPPAPKHTGAPSGKILLRLPKELHQRLLNKAQADNISLNQEILYLLSLGLGQGHMETQIQELAQEIRELKAKYD